MDRLVLPVLMSMLWSGSSTKAIYETDKDSGRSFEEVDDATNKISGQNFDFFFFHSLFYVDTNFFYTNRGRPSPRFGVSNKHQKVSFVALSKLRVSRSGNKFKGNDFSTSRGK